MSNQDMKLLVVLDSLPHHARKTSAMAARAGWRTRHVAEPHGVLAALDGGRSQSVDAVLIDQPVGLVDDLVAAIRGQLSAVPILVVANASSDSAISALRSGATDILTRPLTQEAVTAALTAAANPRDGGELRPLSADLNDPLRLDELIGHTPAFRSALVLAGRAAKHNHPVLFEGEAGTGKKTLAQAINLASSRTGRPFVTVDCKALSGVQLGSALFGHVEGAFAGAFSSAEGAVARAEGGTLFLANIEALPRDYQAMITDLIGSGYYAPLSGTRTRADVRVMATSSHGLDGDVAAGRFERELHHLITATVIPLPPLRERSQDIVELIYAMLKSIARQPGLRLLAMTEGAERMLSSYAWPGNLRQLHDVLFRAAVLCEGNALDAEDFPFISRALGRSEMQEGAPGLPSVPLFYPDGHMRPLEEIEADIIRLAISQYHGRMSEVARRLGIGRSTLYRKLSEFGLIDAAA